MIDMIQFLGAVNSKIVNGQLFTMCKDILNQSLECTVFYKLFRFLSFASKAIQRLCAKLHAMPSKVQRFYCGSHHRLLKALRARMKGLDPILWCVEQKG